MPAAFRAAFAPPSTVLASHRGHDPGTPELGRELARAFAAPLFMNRVTRLLIDANRCAENPARLSKWSQGLPPALLARAEELWARHRDAVAAEVEERLAAGPVLHVSVHSFTPVLAGEVRDVDVGFLYDPRRALERAVVGRWMAALAPRVPRLRLRRNAPYSGTSDGLTTSLRKRFPEQRYAGLELEVSQRFPRAKAPAAQRRWRALRAAIVQALDTRV